MLSCLSFSVLKANQYISALLAVYNGYQFTVRKLQNLISETRKKAIWDTKFCKNNPNMCG